MNLDETQNSGLIESLIQTAIADKLKSAQEDERRRREEIVSIRIRSRDMIIQSLGEFWPELEPYCEFKLDSTDRLVAHFHPFDIELDDFTVTFEPDTERVILAGVNSHFRGKVLTRDLLSEVFLSLRLAYNEECRLQRQAAQDAFFSGLFEDMRDLENDDTLLAAELENLVKLYPDEEEKARKVFKKRMDERIKQRDLNAQKAEEHKLIIAKLAEYKAAYKDWLKNWRGIFAENKRNFDALQAKLDIPYEVYDLSFTRRLTDKDGKLTVRNSTYQVLGPADEDGRFKVIKRGEVIYAKFYDLFSLIGPMVVTPTQHKKCYVVPDGYTRRIYLNPHFYGDPDLEREIREIPPYIETPPFEFDTDINRYAAERARQEVEKELDNES